MKFGVESSEVLVKEAAEHNLVSDIQRDILKYLSKIPTDINVLSSGPEV